MSDILIKGMGMPKDNDYLHLIIQNGKVHTAISCGHLTTDELNVAEAVELPPHGRLGDLDKMRSDFEVISKDYPEGWKLVSGIIDRTPTVLEATE